VVFDSSLDAKEQVRQAIDIVDLVAGYAQLRRQGRGYVALCPWHDDSRPSLQVNPERQSFKCWVCDVGGDVFSFVMKMEGVDFPEALAMLADRAGITLKKTAPWSAPHAADGSADAPADEAAGGAGGSPDSGGSQDSGPDKRTLLKAMAWAERQYHECLLHAPAAEPARRYLQERGITAESIERFRLGFAPLERGWILQQAHGSPSRAKILETIGVLARPASGEGWYDRFRGRALFSIHDAQARPVGLGGRLLPDIDVGSPAKYVNSPETPLFRKSHLLYGLDLAKDAIRKGGVAMVMEGYTDVIVAHQYGFQNAVAVLGTALGEQHVRILKRFADRIVLVLDGDEAGQKRTNEVLELFIAQQADLRILTLPDGLDPCDFLHQRGAAALAELLAGSAVDALEHAFRSATQGVDLERDVHAASQALERLIAIVAKAPRLRHDTKSDDRLREEKILQRFAAMFRVDEAEVRRQVTALRRHSNTKLQTMSPAAESVAAASAEIGVPTESWEHETLALLLACPQHWPMIRERITAAELAAADCRQIFQLACRLMDAGRTPEFDQLMLAADDPSVKSLLVALDQEGRKRLEKAAADAPSRLEGLLKNRKGREVEKNRPANVVALRGVSLETDQDMARLVKIIQEERSRQGISEPTDG
jgi:DNA primase